MELNKEKMLPKVKIFTSPWDNKVAETGPLSLPGVMWAKEDDLPSRRARLRRWCYCLLVLVSTFKCRRWSPPVIVPQQGFWLCLIVNFKCALWEMPSLLRKVKTNMIYTTLFTCKIKLLQSRHSHELKIFLLRNKLGSNVPGAFHAGTPEVKCSEHGWFSSGVLYQSSFWNNCGQMSPRFN